MDANQLLPTPATMDKRPRQPNLQSPVHPSKKKRQPGKLRKTFFFQPQNTLAYNPKQSVDLSEQASADQYEQVKITNRPEANVIVNLDSDPREDDVLTRENMVRVYDKSMEQSSDDSFEGVRWKPPTSPSRLNRPILSSPLRNSEILRQSLDPIGPVDNEVTDSILDKYGVGLSKPSSQTPHCARTVSDGIILPKDGSPSLLRSKSFDPRSLESTYDKDASHVFGSRLNTWIDKFEVKNGVSTLKSSFSSSGLRVTLSSSESTKRELQNSKKDTSAGDDGSATDDDPFSDDDTFLASINPGLFPQLGNLLSTATPTSSTALTLISTGPITDIKSLAVPDSDPFSDDLDLCAIETVAAQVKSEAVSLPDTSEKPVKNLGETKDVSVSFKSEESDSKVGAKLSFNRPDLVRYQILSIKKGTYPYQSFTRNQLILTVCDGNQQESRLIVRGDSAELDFKANDIIHVILTSPDNPRLVDNSNNLIIWNPDILVSSTVVADQLFCPRKTVLSRRLSFPGEATIPLIVGTTVHEIFQACFITEKCDKAYLEELLEVELQRRILDIYTMGDVLDDIKDKVRSHFAFIYNWFAAFYKKAPSEIPTNKRQQKIKFSVAEALDVEESVWSPMFGIKGMADVTLKANLEGDLSNGQFLLPMEIKTSRPYLSHQAQAALYTLLFKDRYNIDISSFLLVYTLEEGSTTKHDISIPDLKSLINLRNRISNYLRPGAQELPDLMRQQKCDKCTIQQSCMSINYLTEEGTAESSGLNEGTYEELTSQLVQKSQYAEFLMYWDDLISKEEEFAARFNRDLWVLTAAEREKNQGKALADLVVCKSWESEVDTDGFQYTFRRRSSDTLGPLNASQISKYDKVIISDNKGHFALAQGFVRHIEPYSITIATRRRIVPTELKTNKFHRADVLRSNQVSLQSQTEAVVFRIDKDEISYGMGVARFNILNLFLANGDATRRRLIVDLDNPRYLSKPICPVEDSEQKFNSDQVSAFKKALLTLDYSLILGMPGTGKTTVIAQLIKMLVSSKKSVLLTSYTNSAVDNILLKVKEHGIDFLRIGNPSRIHQDIREYIPGESGKVVDSYDSFKKVYLEPYVVASTCLSIRDLAFNVRDHFDYCIIDEASQVSMPLSLGPLSLCDKFILVGDHFQLPPLVTHPKPEVKKGLSRSLFQILAEAHPQSVVELTHQYRMNRDIMLISNALVYENRLKCGSTLVADQQLIIPHQELLEKHTKPDADRSSLWLSDVFDPKRSVLFLNHDKLEARERAVGENISNATEVELIRQIVEALCLCGIDESKIGVMTLYRSQLKLLMDTLRHKPKIEVLTADRFQGRDKECIIISLVRSNNDRKVGELLKDWRRVNVAVTRARSKLIVLGSRSTLERAESIRDFVSLAKNKNWMYDLRASAMDVYLFKREVNKPLPGTEKSKIGSKMIGRHAVVRDILSDMMIN